MWRGYDSREWCEECKDCKKLSDYCKKTLQKCYPVYVKVENECFIFRCLVYKRRTETLPELYLLKCPDRLYFWNKDFEKFVLLLTLFLWRGGKKQLSTNSLEPRPPLKKNWFFWSNPCKIEVMTTYLIEMLELPNFGHMTTSTI